MPANVYLALKASLENELLLIEQTVEQLNVLITQGDTIPEMARIPAMAAYIDDFYVGCKKLGEHVALTLDGRLPEDGETLLLKMSDVPVSEMFGRRSYPFLWDSSLAQKLRRYYWFRERDRHANTSINLEATRVESLAQQVSITFQQVEVAIARFGGWLVQQTPQGTIGRDQVDLDQSQHYAMLMRQSDARRNPWRLAAELVRSHCQECTYNQGLVCSDHIARPHAWVTTPAASIIDAFIFTTPDMRGEDIESVRERAIAHLTQVTYVPIDRYSHQQLCDWEAIEPPIILDAEGRPKVSATVRELVAQPQYQFAIKTSNTFVQFGPAPYHPDAIAADTIASAQSTIVVHYTQ